MRYLLLPIILTISVACGDDSAKPLRKSKDQAVDLDWDMETGGVETHSPDMGGTIEEDEECPIFECRKGELLNMIEVKKPYELAVLGGFEFEPEPFEFRDMDF